MYIKMPPDFKDPSTQSPLPDAVLVINDVELRLRAGDVRVSVSAFATVALINDPQAQPTAQQVASAFSTLEIERITPGLLDALYNTLLDRPTFPGAYIVGGAPQKGARTGIWTWDATSGAFHRGEFRTNTKDWPAAKSMLISTYCTVPTDTLGVPIATLLKLGARIQLQSKTDPSYRVLYDVAADAVAGSELDSLTFPIVMRETSSTTPLDGKDCYVSILT